MTIDLDPRKHGLDASQLAVRPDEAAEFNRFLAGLFDDMRPSGELQRLLFGQIVYASWNMRISRKSEAALLLEHGPVAQNLKPVSQFYTRNERAFYKAVTELRNLQTELAYRATLSSDQDIEIPDVPPLVRTAQVHKQLRATTGDRTILQTWNRIRLNRSSG